MDLEGNIHPFVAHYCFYLKFLLISRRYTIDHRLKRKACGIIKMRILTWIRTIRFNYIQYSTLTYRAPMRMVRCVLHSHNPDTWTSHLKRLMYIKLGANIIHKCKLLKACCTASSLQTSSFCNAVQCYGHFTRFQKFCMGNMRPMTAIIKRTLSYSISAKSVAMVLSSRTCSYEHFCGIKTFKLIHVEVSAGRNALHEIAKKEIRCWIWK